MGYAASTALFQSLIHFANALSGHINGFEMDVAIGGAAEVIRGL